MILLRPRDPDTLLAGQNTSVIDLATLPPPHYLPHRGGLNVFPESTREAFRGATAVGCIHLEFDVVALADGAAGIHHDTTVDRTMVATGSPDKFTSGTWQQQVVDASAWFLPSWANTQPVLFDELARDYGGKAVLHPEAKLDARAGQAITRVVQKYGIQRSVVVWASSSPFLEGEGNAIAAGLTCGCISPSGSVDPTTLNAAFTLYMVNKDVCTDARVTELVATGRRIYVYTVNRRVDRDRYLALGVTGIVTDEPAYLAGDGPWRRTTDPFSSATYYHGQSSSVADRGTFVGTGRFHLGNAGGRAFFLQGWAGEIAKKATTYQIACTFTMDVAGSTLTNWLAVLFATPTDAPYLDNGSASENGYNVILRLNGQMNLYRRINGALTLLSSVTGAAITTGSVVPIRVQVSPTAVTVTRDDITVDNVVTSTDTTHRGGYFHFGRFDGVDAGLRCSVASVAIT